MNTTPDPTARVADLGPSHDELARMWGPQQRADVLTRVLSDGQPSARPARGGEDIAGPTNSAAATNTAGFTNAAGPTNTAGPGDTVGRRPRSGDTAARRRRSRDTVGRRRRPGIRVVVAGVAVTAAAVLAGLILPTGSPGGSDPAIAAPLQQLARAADLGGRVGAHQFVRTRTVAYRGVAGRAVVQERNTDWVAPNGADWSLRTVGGRTTCMRFGANLGHTLDSPSEKFLAHLPTDPAELNRYLQAHVSGSTSVDEAVFVAVGDLLRDLDGLTSGRLRAALLDVLGRTGHVSVHAGVRDVLGRPAVRVDFVDVVRRPGADYALYFDPRTSHFLSEGSPVSGRAGDLVGNADAVTSRAVVDSVPAAVRGCELQAG